MSIDESERSREPVVFRDETGDFVFVESGSAPQGYAPVAWKLGDDGSRFVVDASVDAVEVTRLISQGRTALRKDTSHRPSSSPALSQSNEIEQIHHAISEQSSMSEPDIVVLRQKIHGLSAEAYAEELRKRLPERTVTLARTPEEERELLSSAQVATGFTIPEDVIETAADLDLFACVFAGTGHLPIEAFESKEIAVTNASGVHGPNIAEQVVGSILYFTRRFHVAERQQRESHWQSYQTFELEGSTVSIIGLGAIGRAIAERLEPFGVETIGVRYTPEKGGPTDEVVGFDDEQGVHDAFARSDYIVVACPLTDTTRKFIDANAFKSMEPDTVLINIGRGPVVDTDALLATLRNNGIRGAALDVTDPEPLPSDHDLWNFENVLITPHNSGHTPKYWERMADIIAENVHKLDEGEEDFRNRVA